MSFDAMINWLKQFGEWYLGVPPVEPGQGTAWTFTQTTPWPSWLPLGIVLLVAAILLVGVVGIYLRDAFNLRSRTRWGLIFLRLATIGLILFFLTETTLTIDRTGLPFVVLLIDDSASMKLEDQYKESSLTQQVELLIGKEDPATRLALSQALLTRNDGQFLKEILKGHKLRVYHFSDQTELLGNSEYLRTEDLQELIPLIQGLKADGQQTRPGPAIRKVLDDLRGTKPSAVVIISDGITSTTESDSLSSINSLALSKLTPIFTLGIGSEEPSRDLQLYDLRVDEVAFVDDPLLFSATVKGFGFQGKSATVTLKEQGQPAILERKQITLEREGKPQKVELTYIPKKKGEFDYVLEITPFPKEINTRNNSETRRVSVRSEKIGVLLVESSPRYEFRYLKHLLERDKTIKLHSLLMDASPEYAMQDQSSQPLAGRFPNSREKLFDYDVVILGDVNPQDFNEHDLKNLNAFVTERGGGLIMIAGEAYNPLSYKGTLLEDLLPIRLAGAKIPEELLITEDFRPKLTLQGRKSTSIFRFADSEVDSLQIWNELPKLYWMVKLPELKETAVVFAEHPTEQGTNGRLPLIVKRPTGKGIVLFHATDELWRWRFQVEDRYYGRYWIQTIRYLTISRLLGKTHAAVLESDRKEYQQGETVTLWLRFLDEQQAPAEDDGVAVMVGREGEFQQRITLNRMAEAPTVFEGTFTQTVEGSYRASVISPSFPEAPPSRSFRVLPPDQELLKRSIDRAELARTAKETRGRFYTLENAAELPGHLPPGQQVTLETQDPIPLWNRWELLLLFAMLITSEWLLRKRFRLV